MLLICKKKKKKGLLNRTAINLNNVRLKQIELPGNLKYTIKLRRLDLIIVMHKMESLHKINSPQDGKSS